MELSDEQNTEHSAIPFPISQNKTCYRESQPTKNEIMEFAFNSIQDGAVIVCSQGYITHLNEAYGKFLDIDTTEFIGKHCTEVIENTRLHIVAKTGKPEINFTCHSNQMGENR